MNRAKRLIGFEKRPSRAKVGFRLIMGSWQIPHWIGSDQLLSRRASVSRDRDSIGQGWSLQDRVNLEPVHSSPSAVGAWLSPCRLRCTDVVLSCHVLLGPSKTTKNSSRSLRASPPRLRVQRPSNRVRPSPPAPTTPA